MSALKYTLDEVRERQVAAVGTVGIPNPWWPLNYGNGCLAFQLWALGVRARNQMELRHISIAEFLDTTDWDRIPAGDMRPGDLALQNWVGNSNPDHIEWTYSIVPGVTITTIGANTGPAPGVENPKGAWRKTRPISTWLTFGVRPPYRDAAATVTPKRRALVRAVAGYLNGATDGPDLRAANDGIPGPAYWTRVQAWGRKNGLYPAEFVIDGIPGVRTRFVEAAVHKRTLRK